jgi:uncharacterized delta-60 repeat protein
VLAGLSPGFSVMRINSNGTVDTTFGNGGTASAPLSSAGAYSLLVQPPDGKIVVAGTIRPGPAREDFVVARFTPSGSPDETFGSGGTVTTDLGGPTDVASSVALGPDGKIVLAGSSMPAYQSTSDFGVARYVGALAPCKVPSVLGKTLAAARTSITRAECKVGKVTRKRSKRAKKGRVISQSPRAGASLPNGSKVNLVVSKGRGR